jgi:hypothetical protein
MKLEFLGTNLNFEARTRSVRVSALYDGTVMDVIISRPVLEQVAQAERLTQDEAFTTVVQNRKYLELAAARACSRHGAHVPIVTIGLADLVTAELKPIRLIRPGSPSRIVPTKA